MGREADSFAALRNDSQKSKSFRALLVSRWGGGFFRLFAYGVAVALLQAAEDDGRDHGEDAQGDEGFVDAVDHFGGGGGAADVAGGDEEGRGEAGGGYSKADGHLLHGAGDGAGGAGLLLVGVGVDQGVHAGVLQRGEGSVEEGQEHDHPDGVCRPMVAKSRSSRPRTERVRDQDPAVADGGEQAGHKGFHAHGS